MSPTNKNEPTKIDFETGYGRLKEIAEKVNAEEVPVHEMCELFAEGKGLEQALTKYLSEQKTQIEDIERGDGVKPFQIVPPDQSSVTPKKATAKPKATIEPDETDETIFEPEVTTSRGIAVGLEDEDAEEDYEEGGSEIFASEDE